MSVYQDPTVCNASIGPSELFVDELLFGKKENLKRFMDLLFNYEGDVITKIVLRYYLCDVGSVTSLLSVGWSVGLS